MTWWPWRRANYVSLRWMRQQRRQEAATATRDYGVMWLASEEADKLKAELRRRLQVWRQNRKRA